MARGGEPAVDVVDITAIDRDIQEAVGMV